MQMPFKNIDEFSRNTIIVFVGTSLVNFFNLLYQLLIAHQLSASSFAAFNSLLSVFLIISSPLGTIQFAMARYTAEFNANSQINRIKFLLSVLLKRVSIIAASIFIIFWFNSGYMLSALKIPSITCGYILSFLIALSCLTPVFLGAIQGLELFGWLAAISVITGVLKLALSFLFLLLGYDIAGALGALLASSLIGLALVFFPLRFFFSIKGRKENIQPIAGHLSNTIDTGLINYNEIFSYLFPVAISYFCFFILVSLDMVLVKIFFIQEDAGLYSLAQMVGKIFLFLPAAISIVMFPKTSGLNAKNMETTTTLKRSLLSVLALCTFAFLFYNLFPGFVLKVLTGKIYPESIFLGRLFSVSMSFFSLLNILIAYFLSIKDLRFIKYLILFTILQSFGIILFHKSLAQVLSLLCINSILLFFMNLSLVNFKKRPLIID